MSNAAAPRWIARIGASMSLMATTVLILMQWRTWSGPAEVSIGLMFCMGHGVVLGMLWTALQATIHTRLGSRPMFPDHPQRSVPLPTSSVIRWISLVTGLVLLWWVIDSWSFFLIVQEATGDIFQTMLFLLEGLLWDLWPRLAMGIGLGFGASLLVNRLRPADSLSTVESRSLPACQVTPQAEPVRPMHRGRRRVTQ